MLRVHPESLFLFSGGGGGFLMGCHLHNLPVHEEQTPRACWHHRSVGRPECMVMWVCCFNHQLLKFRVFFSYHFSSLACNLYCTWVSWTHRLLPPQLQCKFIVTVTRSDSMQYRALRKAASAWSSMNKWKSPSHTSQAFLSLNKSLWSY